MVWLEARTGLGTVFQLQVTPWRDKTGTQTESHEARVSVVREHIPGQQCVCAPNDSSSQPRLCVGGTISLRR